MQYKLIAFAAAIGVVAGCGSDYPDLPSTTVAQQVTLPDGFGIDRTEVTRRHYEAWLAKSPDTRDQPGYCAWNGSYAPDEACMRVDEKATCTGSDCENHPQVCVDWCDAHAYCEAVGKRLCGRVGGGASPFESTADSTASQWYAACSADGALAYGYGDHGAASCNTVELGIGRTIEAGGLPDCRSSVPGYDGVLDMSGNVWEWEDSCRESVGGDDFCHVRGGSFNSVTEKLACGEAHQFLRSFASYFVGFRCCSK